MSRLTQIFAFTARSEVHDTAYTRPEGSVWFPEIAYDGYIHPLPKTPQEIIAEAHTLVGRCVFTMSEYVILWFLHEIREEWMKPEEVQLFCNRKQISIDRTGELINRWPGGFFRERGRLLF